MSLSAPVTPLKSIRIAAAVLMRDDDHILLVRKAGTSAFMQAGGKIEAGETPVTALLRELQEELGLSLTPDLPRYMGFFSAEAANEPGYTVEAEIFMIALAQPVHQAAEIEEIIWVDPLQPQSIDLAPLTEHYLLPLCKQYLKNRTE